MRIAVLQYIRDEVENMRNVEKKGRWRKEKKKKSNGWEKEGERKYKKIRGREEKMKGENYRKK